MKIHFCSLLTAFSALLLGCASAPVTRTPDGLFADARFAPTRETIRGEDVFALSEPMQAYLNTEIARRVRSKGPRRGLFEALRNELKIEYDAVMTRTAAQTFDARAGNCLSLVMLTAAFAKQLGVPVRYQAVYGYNTWSRSGGIAFLSGHINLALGPRGSDEEHELTVDFLPPQDIAGQHRRAVSEATVIAMYLNNRAAEILAQGEPERAYWWTREAIKTAPAFLPSYNTLGVIYRRHGNLPEASATLAYALEREPANAQVLSNLAEVFAEQGRVAQARELKARLARIEPYPPFHFFDQGLAALGGGDYKRAAELFGQQLARTPYDDQLHYATALAELRLGQLKRARKHIRLALENSSSRESRGIYAAKLQRLKSAEIH